MNVGTRFAIGGSAKMDLVETGDLARRAAGPPARHHGEPSSPWSLRCSAREPFTIQLAADPAPFRGMGGSSEPSAGATYGDRRAVLARGRACGPAGGITGLHELH